MPPAVLASARFRRADGKSVGLDMHITAAVGSDHGVG